MRAEQEGLQAAREAATFALIADPRVQVVAAGDTAQARAAGMRMAGYVEARAPELLRSPACRQLVDGIEPFRTDPARRPEAIKRLQGIPPADLPGMRLATKAALAGAERSIDKLELRTGLDLVHMAMRHHRMPVPEQSPRPAAPARARSGGQEL
jgi:hypothetical protein